MATTTDPETHQQPALDLADLPSLIEAILITSEKQTPTSRIASIIAELPGATPLNEDEIENAIADLNQRYDDAGSAFRIEKLAAGFRLMTRPQFAPVIAASGKANRPSKLSRPALETLSIIAYRQPLTRADIEAIRGVACGEVLKTLLERKLITIAGRAEEVGRPMLYATTRQFLDAFGLSSLKDLPQTESEQPQTITAEPSTPAPEHPTGDSATNDLREDDDPHDEHRRDEG